MRRRSECSGKNSQREYDHPGLTWPLFRFVVKQVQLLALAVVLLGCDARLASQSDEALPNKRNPLSEYSVKAFVSERGSAPRLVEFPPLVPQMMESPVELEPQRRTAGVFEECQGSGECVATEREFDSRTDEDARFLLRSALKECAQLERADGTSLS